MNYKFLHSKENSITETITKDEFLKIEHLIRLYDSSIFTIENEWIFEKKRYNTYKFPFNVSNQSLAKQNRVIRLKTFKTNHKASYRIKRIDYYVWRAKSLGVARCYYRIEVEKLPYFNITEATSA